MTFSQSVSTVFHKYVDFNGRASRSEYWWFALFELIVYAALNILGAIFGSHSMPGWVYFLEGAFSLAVLLPSIGVSVRRMHDIGKGGGWIFITLIPFIGQIWFIILALMPSEPQPNRFGPVPD